MLNYLIILILSISTYVSAKETKFEKRLQKDIKKLSRISGFIDNNLKLYDEEEISDKKNTIVVIFNHGQQDGQKKVERCNKGASDVPEFVRNLHNKKVNDLTIKIYRMCSGVRGLNDPQMDRIYKMIEKDENTNGLLEVVDYDGTRLFDKVKQHLRRQIVLDKIMQSGGMQQEDFDACLSNVELENQLLEGVMEAQREYKIGSTPSFIINGVLYSGNKNIKEFRQIIDKILSQ